MSKIFNLFLEEVALLFLGKKVVFPEDVKGLVQMLGMCFKVSAVHQDVIDIYEDEYSNMFTEYIIHQGLEGCWGICKAKRHYNKFVVSKSCAEGGLWDVFLLDTNLVVS